MSVSVSVVRHHSAKNVDLPCSAPKKTSPLFPNHTSSPCAPHWPPLGESQRARLRRADLAFLPTDLGLLVAGLTVGRHSAVVAGGLESTFLALPSHLGSLLPACSGSQISPDVRNAHLFLPCQITAQPL